MAGAWQARLEAAVRGFATNTGATVTVNRSSLQSGGMLVPAIIITGSCLSDHNIEQIVHAFGAGAGIVFKIESCLVQSNDVLVPAVVITRSSTQQSVQPATAPSQPPQGSSAAASSLPSTGASTHHAPNPPTASYTQTPPTASSAVRFSVFTKK